jgi:hypothetical protein
MDRGYSPFICYYAVMLTRLAYIDDNLFPDAYNSIKIPTPILKSLNACDIKESFQDEKIYKGPFYTYENEKFLDINKLNLNVQDVFDDIYNLKPLTPTKNNLIYISISNSNYREVYIVIDKRMPDSMWILFRGTYSAKSLSSYIKISSITPYTIYKDKFNRKISFVRGMIKLLMEIIHLIVESMHYLANTYMKGRKIKVHVTGHSLGGSLATMFAYIWNTKISKTYPYNNYPFTSSIVCIPVGVPRTVNHDVAVHYCELIYMNEIMYKRISTNGDPIGYIPLKLNGYQNPCSNSILKENISIYCNSLFENNVFHKDNPLECKKTRKNRSFSLDHHGNYLGINTKHRPHSKLKGLYQNLEIARDNGDTVCRIILYDKKYTQGYINLTLYRSNTKIKEDFGITEKVFHNIIKQFTPMIELSLSFDTIIPYEKDKAPLFLE